MTIHDNSSTRVGDGHNVSGALVGLLVPDPLSVQTNRPGSYTHGMTKSTTVKVSTSTRDALKEIADRDGISLDAAIRKLLRSERQRVMGAELAERSATDDDVAWVTGATAAVARAIR